MVIKKNISVTLNETNNDKKDVTYDELVNIVNLMDIEKDMGSFVAQEVNYQTNFTKPQLEKIAKYYNISKRKKKKDELIQDIVIFEIDPNNIEIVFKRKKLWAYMKEIKQDRYLSKFLIFN